MKYTEQLLWILDKNCQIHWSEEKTKQNIDFVHALGLKCDCVGWSKLDLASSRTSEVLDAIEDFCKENGWGARGYYTREYAETTSQWYAIRFAEAKNDRYGNSQEVPAEDGSNAEIYSLKSYLEYPVSPKELYEVKFVPERFRDACLKLGMDDIEFCWAADKGKYRSEQYFHPYPKHAVSHLAKNNRFYYSTKGIHGFDPEQAKRMKELGGSLPRLSEIFYELRISLPNCYLKTELPDKGFSSAYIPRTRYHAGFQNILIHADTAALLLQEKALAPTMLMAVPVLDTFPAGYEILNTARQSPPTVSFRETMLREYEKIKANPRPIRMVTEKEALKTLRRVKKERAENFTKALPKVKVSALNGTAYNPLIPYYSISNGGYLSDEYQLLSYNCAITETEKFLTILKSEELLEEQPDGVVIAKCPDGDTVLLCRNGSIIRFSHEAPEIVDQWPTLAQFITDTVNEVE